MRSFFTLSLDDNGPFKGKKTVLEIGGGGIGWSDENGKLGQETPIFETFVFWAKDAF